MGHVISIVALGWVSHFCAEGRGWAICFFYQPHSKCSSLQYGMACLLLRIHHCATCNPLLGCSNYTYLNESSRAMTYNKSISYLCDANLNGWYRFTGEAGTQMADSCVNMYHCGTESPGWLNGTHPDLTDGAVKRQVCFSSFDNCCHHSNEITVQHCGAFYVYKLEGQSHCNLRYCGNGSPYAQGNNKNKTTLNNRFISLLDRRIFTHFPINFQKFMPSFQ